MSAPILVGGEALYDLVADAGGRVAGHAGGGPFNTARTIGRLRQPVAFLGRLSTDRLGRTLRRMLVDDGVGLQSVVPTSAPTTLALADVDAQGGAEYHFYEAGTSAPGLTAEAALRALPDEVAALHIGTLGLVLEPLATALEAVVAQLHSRTLVAVDPNCRPSVITDPAGYRERLRRLLERADLVKVSAEDLEWLDPGRPAAQAARRLLDGGPAVVLLTCGAKGATVVMASGEVDIAPRPATVVDTIGAGDAFNGGFLAWWRSRDLGRAELGDAELVVEAARFASVVAGRTVEQAGASPPRLEGTSSSGALDLASL
ncbi:MAG: fructokinase [Solirubrobacteraceae bacterium]|nr:fructokinase [Solirubrobacteraceae bacterium]